MAFVAIMRFPSASGVGSYLPFGESRQVPGGIELKDDWSFALTNTLNITTHTTGTGSGKAVFEQFTIKKQVDKASPSLYEGCGAGATWMGVTVSLYKSTGADKAVILSNQFVKWTFNMLAVEKIEWSHDDESPRENVTFKFGSCGVMYGMQEDKGMIIESGRGQWNQVANCSDITSMIMGAKSQSWLT